jgi:hypothetical protein
MQRNPIHDALLPSDPADRIKDCREPAARFSQKVSLRW